MPEQDRIAYYAKREEQERDLAAAASDPSARAIHLDMAERYAELQIESAKARPRLSLFG